MANGKSCVSCRHWPGCLNLRRCRVWDGYGIKDLVLWEPREEEEDAKTTEILPRLRQKDR